MKSPLRTFEQLLEGKKIIEKSYFEPSVQGFILNVNNSFKGGIITEEELNRLGQFAIPCDCGGCGSENNTDCLGWAMIKKDKQGIIDHATLYIHDN